MEYSFGPLADKNSKILILGSLPGVRSLAEARYYAHPQNKFWKIIYGAWGRTPDADFDARYSFILEHGLALWDVIKCARRKGSADGNIRDEIPNDVPALLAAHPNIRRIIFNGGFAFSKYKKYFGIPQIDYRRVLSTSPTCAGRDREREDMWRDALSGLTLLTFSDDGGTCRTLSAHQQRINTSQARQKLLPADEDSR